MSGNFATIQLNIPEQVRENHEYLYDGRTPLDHLYQSYEELVHSGVFEKQLICFQEFRVEGHQVIQFPIYIYQTPLFQTKASKSVLVLSGIHGEEPAGPIAISQSIESLITLAKSENSVVIIPLLNPAGYFRNWRYENMAEFDSNRPGQSVSDAEHLLLSPDQTSPRQLQPSGNTAKENTAAILKLIEKYHFDISVDLHEDKLLTEGCYVYSQGERQDSANIAQMMTNDMQQAGIPIHPDGKTRFVGEIIHNGVVTSQGGGVVQDGSIDELLATRTYWSNNGVNSKFAVPHVFVTELPTQGKWGELSTRVKVYKKNLENISKYTKDI